MPGEPVGLGLDAGGTATRWRLATAGNRHIATGQAAAISGHIFNAEARRKAFAALDAIALAITAHAPPDAVVAGITGLDAGTPEAQAFRAAIAERFGLCVDAVAIGNDMNIAYHAAFGGPGRGILVYSGTGSIGFHIAADGQVLRVGGRGVIIDDAGSGFWIAKQAVKAIFRAEDRAPGSGFATLLGHHIGAAIGGADWEHARAFVYGGERGRVAALAPAVAAAAAGNDAVALAILETAGRELALLAATAAERIGWREVVLAGGTSTLSPVIERAFRAALPAATPIEVKRIDPAAAAAQLAVAAAGRREGNKPPQPSGGRA